MRDRGNGIWACQRGPTRRHSGKRSSWPNSRLHGSLMSHVSKLRGGSSCVPSYPRVFGPLVAAVRHWGMLTGTDGARIILRGALGLPRRTEGKANTGIVLLHWVKAAQCLQFSNSNRARDLRNSHVPCINDVQKVMHC